METIFLVNLAVSLVMALGLWLVWRHDPEQTFARSMAWVTLFNGVSGVAFALWKSPDPFSHGVGAVLLPAAVGFIFSNAYAGVAYLGGWIPKRSYAVTLWAVYFAVYSLLIGQHQYTLIGYINCVSWLVSGFVTLHLLWRKGWLARSVGVLLLCTGLNSGFVVMQGTEGLPSMFAVGLVLRVALGIVLMCAAMLRTQEKSQHSKARYKVLSQNAPLGVVVVSQDAVLYANPAAARTGGYASVDALMADDIFSLLPQAQHLAAREHLRKLLAGEGDQLEAEVTCNNKQGQTIHLQISAWRIQWDGRDAVQMVFSDETQKHAAAEELKSLQDKYERQRVEFAERSKNALLKANAELEVRVALRTRELEEASLAKSQFLASMSHEIRTPMNVVLGLLELLLATQQTPTQADYAHKAKRAAKSLLGLLNDLLDFSKIDAGKMELELLPFSFERLLRDLSNMVPTMVGDKPVEVLFDIDPTLPDAFRGDAFRLQQVLLNLLSNAIKFTAQGDVLVQVQVCRRTLEEATLRISVRDTGIGIAPENQRYIFEVFAQAESSITRRFGGSGLGLSICKKLLTLMESDLQLHSELGKGSCFYFELTLPLVDTASADSKREAERHFDRDLYVLVVDDNEAARTLTVTMARGLGWRVEAVAGGSQAINMVQAISASGHDLFDAILVDWRMQPLDGWETLRRIRALYPPGRLPACVMASAYGREVLAQRPQEDQQLLSAFLTKPVTASMLGDAVGSACHGQGNVRSGPRPKVPKGLRLKGMRVLLVEDNPLNQLVARELLSAEGAQIATADNGALALTRLADEPAAFDVVLMDMQMPVMDGCTATQEIRKTLKLTTLPVVAMTANTMQSDKDACLAAGMNDHVGKPFDIGYLVEVIRKQCGLPPFRLETIQKLPPALSEKALDFDAESAVAALEGDRVLYAQVLRAFLDELSTLPGVLARQLESGERVTAKRTLHTLKGTAATVGALALSRTANVAEAEVAPEIQADVDARIVAQVREAAQEAVRQLAALAYAE